MSVLSDIASAILQRYVEDPLTGCWIWTGAKSDKRGYGVIRVMGKNYYTHRLAAHVNLGMPLDGRPHKQANHACDNPSCIRTGPDHIYVGSQKQNLREMHERGRANHSNPARGEHHGKSVMTEEKVRLIRSLRSEGQPYAAIAEAVGVKVGSIADVIFGRTWSWCV